MTSPSPSARALALSRHRMIFLYALEHRMTLADAEKAMAREQWASAQAKLKRNKMCGRQGSVTIDEHHFDEQPKTAPPEDAPWMMRD